MSETIEYSGEFTEIKSEEEMQELWELISDSFNDADIDTDSDKGTLEFVDCDGWRGGGNTCYDLLKEWLSLFFEQHPHIKGTIWARYVEQAPTESFYVENGEIKGYPSDIHHSHGCANIYFQ